jgi:hypothetical protein
VFARDPNLTNLKNDLRFAQFIADQKKTVGILQDGALTRCGIGGPSSHIVPV